MLVRDDTEYIRRNDLSEIFNDNIESLFIEIPSSQFAMDQNVLVGVVYRPPNTDINGFNVMLNELLTKLKTESRKKIYLTGDFNINVQTQ